MTDVAAHMAALLREAAAFIERQQEELDRMTRDRDSLRLVVESLQTEIAVARVAP